MCVCVCVCVYLNCVSVCALMYIKVCVRVCVCVCVHFVYLLHRMNGMPTRSWAFGMPRTNLLQKLLRLCTITHRK